MNTYNNIMQGSVLTISVMLLLNGCSGFTVTELEENQYSVGYSPDFFPIMGDVWMPGTGAAFETRRQNLIKGATKYCEKHGKVAAIESINAVPPFLEGDSGVLVIFSCISNDSDTY